jgi:hypothetical protein
MVIGNRPSRVVLSRQIVPFCVRAIAVFVFGASLSLGVSLCAQPNQPVRGGDTLQAEGQGVGTAGVHEVGPWIFYVKDESGQIVPVLNLTLTELHRLMQRDPRQSDASAQLPKFTLQSLQIRGVMVGTRVHLTVDASIRLLTENWTRVPLRFGNAVWREPPAYEGDAELVVLFEGEQEGYVCWLRGSEGQFCSISLELMTAVEQVGSEFRLDLQLPRATSATFDLEVPIAGATAMVSNGLLEVLDAGEASRLVVSGVGGDFRLAWRKGDPRPAPPSPLLEAGIEQVVKVDGVRQVTADLRLRVSSLRGEFDSFTVRLPIGARLFPRQFNQSGLRLVELPDADTGAKRIEIRLDRATMAAVEVQLLIEHVATADSKGIEYDLGGLEVEDAFRQSGTIDFAAKSGLRLSWKPVAGVQRTFVPEALRQKLSARFEMTRRSYSLLMQVSSQETQISVEPVYQLYVDQRTVQLDAVFKYRIRGASPYGLNIQLAGWQVTQIGPETLIDSEALEAGKTEPLFIPLTAAMPDSGELTLHVKAQQQLPEGADRLSLTLPRPEARSWTPAPVVIVSADNLELKVSEPESKGLERDPFPPLLELTREKRRQMFYRERREAAASTLVAELEVHPRSVSISAEADVKLDARVVRVQQRFQYRVSYEALRRLQFTMPRELFEAGDVQFVYQQQALPVIEWHAPDPNGPSPAEEESWVRVEVDPLGELIGQHEITVQHDQSLTSLSGDREIPWVVPLVQPWLSDGTVITSNTARVQGGPEISFRLNDQRWESKGNGTAGGEAELTLAADGMPLDLSIRVSRRDVRRQSSTIVSRAWIETRWDTIQRRDRAVFRVVTNQDRVAVELPGEADLLRVGLDGGDVTDLVLRDQQQTRTIEVSPGQEHVLELWYTIPVSARWPGVLRLDVPRVIEAKSNHRVYWTLMMPPNMHLLVSPAGLTPELTWTWRGLFWGRVSRLQPMDLERWMGATEQFDDFPLTVNHYLFSSFGALDSSRFSVATRGTVLSAMSGMALLAGLALIYVRRLRHPAVLFVAGVTLFALILAYPDLAAALAQAAALGLLLSLTACALKWMVDRRPAGGSMLQGVAYASPDSQTVRASALQSPSPGATSTTTIPASVVSGESQA